jgi:hypothetical protein
MNFAVLSYFGASFASDARWSKPLPKRNAFLDNSDGRLLETQTGLDSLRAMSWASVQRFQVP